jgi:hypothetical protein
MTKTVAVTLFVAVTVDERKFTPEFMAEFKESFYDFTSLDQHIEHLAQLHVRGEDGAFIEGYGDAAEMGIKFDFDSLETEIVDS